MTGLLANKYIAGALAGFIAAALVDFNAFRTWKSVDDAMRYDWKLAGWRWAQGAISGALVAAGIGVGIEA